MDTAPRSRWSLTELHGIANVRAVHGATRSPVAVYGHEQCRCAAGSCPSSPGAQPGSLLADVADVAARRSCFGAATGRCYVQPSLSFSQLSRHAGVGQCAGYQGMPWSRQGAPRIAASATSIECSLDTRHGHDGSPASVVSSLLAGAGERGQVHVPELAAGWVCACPSFSCCGRACLLASTAVGWGCRLRFRLRSCVPVVHSCGSPGAAAAAAGVVGGAAPSAELFSVNGGVTPGCPPAQSCRSGLVCASALVFVLSSVGILVHWCISNLPETRALLQGDLASPRP